MHLIRGIALVVLATFLLTFSSIAIALAAPKVAEHTAGKTIKKVVVVPGRLVNVVV